jgi:GMP synthase-like glutamine amidotransferase
MQQAVREDKNVLAVCFGFQLLAQAMFGVDAVCARSDRGAVPELGWAQVTVTKDDPLLGEAGVGYWGYVSHFDDVCTIDETMADVIANSTACPIQGFKLKGKNVWGLQAHFEIDIETGKRYNENFIAAFPPLREMILEPARDSEFINLLMPRFEQL